ncbi:MAG: hypothetical protein ACTSRE_16495 [Promethearchaeota archaeon]
MSNKNRESTELRQDTALKKTKSLETRIKYFQGQQSSKISGKFLDIAAKTIIVATRVGQSLKKTIPEELQKKILKIYQKLLLSF